MRGENCFEWEVKIVRHNYEVEIDGEKSIVIAPNMATARRFACTAALGVSLKQKRTVSLTIHRQTSSHQPHSESVTALGLLRK